MSGPDQATVPDQETAPERETAPEHDQQPTQTAMSLAVDGPAAPPRTNGEITFDAPWQSRAFGAAAVLCENGDFSWGDFQQALIEAVAVADTSGLDTGEPSVYWECWLEALGALIGRNELVDPAQWSERSRLLAQREPGHDH